MEWPRNKPWLVLMGVIVLVQVFSSSSGCFPEEKVSLLDFKAAYCNGSLLPSWVDDPKSNCCDWERVTCDSSSGHVIDLSLDHLRTNSNMYGDCLSARLNWSLFLSFKELRGLDLSHNCFEDFIWKGVSKLEILEFLSLDGSFPSQGLCEMKKLEELYLNDNDFERTLDTCLGNMTSLRTLDLSRNSLSGSIPASIREISSLTTLDLGHNNFSGNVPANILGGCTSLNELMLNNNQLDGTLDSWLGNHPVTDLTRCPSTPAEGLYIIDLSHNKFSGELPSTFMMPPFLVFINFQGNSLTGTIPGSFFSGLYLVAIDLSDNNFTGTIPESIYGLESLVFVLLAGNQLQGQLSSQICQLQSLQILDLSRNNFTGSIPSCLNNMAFGDINFNLTHGTETSLHTGHAISYRASAKFVEYSMEEVQFITKGSPFPYQGDTLKIMSALDLSCNQLTGEIPHQLGDLSGLHALNLSHNHLKGPIPESFHKLESIESVDLSNNNLSGQIPFQLQELHSLSVFNVSCNNLSGRAPDKGQFGTFDESSYRGNPYLTWSNSNRRIATPSPLSTPLGEGKKDDSAIDFTSFYWSFAASFVTVLLTLVTILWINPYWRRAWFYFIEGCLLKCFGEFLEDAFY